jgi:molybdenum cofactor biosynthesis protein B
VRGAVARSVESPDVDAVITTGGTGIARRDGTYEVIADLLDKRIDGFGELFRALSFEEIGPAAMLSRACAGLAGWVRTGTVRAGWCQTPE